MRRTASLAPDRPDLDVFAADFEEFHARFADLFGRAEPREQAAKYLRGLLGNVERRNGWQLAEALGDALPDRMQRLLNRSDWSAVEARNRLVDFCIEVLGDPEAIAVLDETGFVKKGDQSVGVQRQYSGTAGKTENCQIGVFLGYAGRAGHVLLDRALYLPVSWCNDATRRERARVPEKVRFYTKPQLAARMLRRAWRRGVPMAWITGDEVYGNDPTLRAAIDAAGRRYVLAVAANTPVWAMRPATIAPEVAASRPGRGGRARTRTRLAPGAPRASTVQALTAMWPAAAWHRLAVREGEKGPIEYDWAAARVVDSRGRLPADDVWLLARRSVSDPKDIAWYLSNAPSDTPLRVLARVAATRFTIEQCFEEAKDDVGLDQYEVRTWPAWHRHITLAMMALAWLASVRLALERTDPTVTPMAGKKGGLRGRAPSRAGRSRRRAA
jgi:SRSO17 transposase